jgi:hypothetical protein
MSVYEFRPRGGLAPFLARHCDNTSHCYSFTFNSYSKINAEIRLGASPPQRLSMLHSSGISDIRSIARTRSRSKAAPIVSLSPVKTCQLIFRDGSSLTRIIHGVSMGMGATFRMHHRGCHIQNAPLSEGAVIVAPIKKSQTTGPTG